MAKIPGVLISDEVAQVDLDDNDFFIIANTTATPAKNFKISGDSIKQVMVGSESREITVGGAITLTNNEPLNTVTVDVNGGVGATDDLDDINGGYTGQRITLQATDSARTVVVKNGTGNIYCDGGADFSLNHIRDKWDGIIIGSEVHEVGRSNNG